MEMPIRGVYADESVNACMGVRSGQAKYGVADSPAEETAPSQALFNLFPSASSPHWRACLCIRAPTPCALSWRPR